MQNIKILNMQLGNLKHEETLLQCEEKDSEKCAQVFVFDCL